MNKNIQYIVISHTHWDREWYQSFDMFRMRLADLMNNLLDIVKNDENYIFYLDAQTIVLEDYLQIHPWRKDELKKYISNGQIVIGPWYVQNDFYLSNGESTIRNLLIGTEIANQFGRCANTAYCPDQFGIIGQLPQIMKGFGLEGFVFGRGNTTVKEGENGVEIIGSAPEFFWQGSDGTKVLALCMVRWYNNAQRFSQDINKSKRLIDINEEDIGSRSVVPFRLMMNGVDHLEAQEDLLPILEKLKNEENINICQGRLEDVVIQTRDYINKNKCEIPTVFGELRNGFDDQILQGTLSSRVYLKQNNDLCENILMHRLEPLYCMLKNNGFLDIYPKDYLKYLWKMLVQNHAHDSICGCSNDIVHRQMEERFFRIQQIANELINRGIHPASLHNDLIDLNNDDYIITLANTTQLERNETVNVKVRFPENENVEYFELYDSKGEKIDYVLKKSSRVHKNIYSPINLPGGFAVDEYEITFAVKEMPPYSFDFIKVTPKEIKKFNVVEHKESSFIENDLFRIELNKKGSLKFLNKVEGSEIEDFLSFEDTGDSGHSYNFHSIAGDMPISSVNALISHNKTVDLFEERLNISYEMMLPEGLINGKRSGNLVPHKIDVSLSLSKVDKKIRVNYSFENKSKFHRMRLKIKTGIKTESSFALSAFETVKRRVGEGVVDKWRNPDLPNAGLIVLKDDVKSTAIYNLGLHEYEHLNSNGDIAITILRATGSIVGMPEDVDIDWQTPEGQCLRLISGEIVIETTLDIANAIRQNATVKNGILSYFDSVDFRKFSGGRPALQDSELNELFFREDKYKDLSIKSHESMIEIDNPNIVVTTFKEAENSREYILRIYNSSLEKQNVSVKLPKGTKNVFRAKMTETSFETLEIIEGKLILELSGAEILTIKFN